MATEAGHAPSRIYFDQNGDMHLNGAKIFNDAEEDIAPALESLDQISIAELEFLDGALAGSQVAGKTLVPDANKELDGIGVIEKVDKLISTAQVLALFGTPIEIVPAPGAGVYLEFLGAYIFLDYNSAAYASDAGEDLVFKYTNAAGAVVSHSIDGTVFHATADALAYARPSNPAADTIVAVANAAIVLHLLVGEWITGNSPLKIRCYYRTIRKAALEAIA